MLGWLQYSDGNWSVGKPNKRQNKKTLLSTLIIHKWVAETQDFQQLTWCSAFKRLQWVQFPLPHNSTVALMVLKMRRVVSASYPTKTGWFWATFPGCLGYTVFVIHVMVWSWFLLSRACCLDGAEFPCPTLCLISLLKEKPGTRIWVQTKVYAEWLFGAERLEGNSTDELSPPGHGEVKALFFAQAAEAQGQILSHTPALLWHRELEMQSDLHSWGRSL